MTDARVQFALNGKKVSIAADAVDPDMTLNEFIRRHSPYSGTKIACGEGGCGACAVDIARKENDGSVTHISVNSCLRSVASMDGWSVTTTEGLGSVKKGLHPVQQRIVAFNGTQCGFCTPGMVMTMYSTLKSGEELSKANIEQRLDGNICRCTGYRPILDACKSLASDADMDAVVFNTDAAVSPAYDPAKHDPAFPPFLAPPSPAPLTAQSPSGTRWIRASSLSDVFDALDAYPESGHVKLVVGNTCRGIYKQDPARVLVDLQYLPELAQVTRSKEALEVGAACSITVLHRVLVSAMKECPPASVASFSALAKHVLRVANVHVRNAGSVGGNLAMAKCRGFLSDLATILLGIEASVTLVSRAGSRSLSMSEFLSSPSFAPGELLHSIAVPFDLGDTRFLTYKSALRAQNSHAFVNAAFKVRVGADGVVQHAVLAFGGVQRDDLAGSHAVLATRTAAALVGRAVNADLVHEALELVQQEVVVAAENHDAAYRRRLVPSFLYKFLVAICDDAPPSVRSSAADVTLRAPSRATQTFAADTAAGPVAKPVTKISAPAQATGEARFTDDIPIHANALFAAPVGASVARARLVRVEAAEALAVPGVAAVITAADIERIGGKNNCSPLGQDQMVMVSDTVSYHHQPIALVVAESERVARAAAKLVRGVYEDVKRPAVTLAQAMAEEEEFGTPTENEHVVGDAAAVLEAAERTVRGTVELGTQQHFYMETQSAYAVPDETGAIQIFCPNQWPDAAQSGLAMCLGLPMHKVTVVHRRAGGAFGGKLTHAIGNAALAAVAAVALARPVRLVLERSADMRMAGGREEVRAEYEAAFEPDGKITALRVNALMNAGWLLDLSWFTNFALVSAMNQVYGIPNLVSASRIVHTNMPARTVVRGPGEIQASYIVETVVEHVAHATGLSPEAVRRCNFYDEDEATVPNGNPIAPFTIPTLWEHLEQKAKAQELRAEVAAFNAANRWKKRGLSMTPVRYEVGVWQKNALVNVYGTDGTVLIQHSGSEMGQGMNTKVAQAAALALGRILGLSHGIPLDKIAFGDMATNVCPNGTFTGGSTGSEGTAAAVMRCCETLGERMKPELEKLRADKEGDADVTWEELCAACKGANVNLSAQDHWSSAGDDALHYQNYGVCLSTVELDVLTGEVNVLSASLLYDCGRSLNPAIDVGQCEGAFMMGLGFYLRERMLVNEEDGSCGSEGTWEYKPPGVRDVPQEFHVELMEKMDFEKGILSSKASGEPPLVLATSVIMAVRHAIEDARRANGLDDFFSLPVPATPADIQAATGCDPSKLTFQ